MKCSTENGFKMENPRQIVPKTPLMSENQLKSQPQSPETENSC